jgi:transposase
MADSHSQDLSRDELLALVEDLRRQVAALREENAALKSELAQARKNSSNSSKPPSSDIVKPPPQGHGGDRRHIGAQPGHPRHERAPFPPEKVDRRVDHTPGRCPECGGTLRPEAEPALVVQQVEFVAQPFQVTEHVAANCRCRRCGASVYAQLPPEIAAAGLLGPQLSAHLVWLKTRGHLSYSNLQRYLRDAFGLQVSRGLLDKVVQKAGHGLRPVWDELYRAVRSASRLHVDETGHPEAGARLWNWVFRARDFTLYTIQRSRGSKVLERVLSPIFQGVLHADYFSAYRKYIGAHHVRAQFCLAHFIRDALFLKELPDPVTRRYGAQVVRRLRQLFRVLHGRERYATPETFQRALERARDRLRQAVLQAPERTEPRNLARRFRQHGDDYLRFVTTPDVDPTNNLAEQALRFTVLNRRMTQGTRSPNGRRARETLWTVAQTCTQQGRSFYGFLVDALSAHFTRRPLPSLLPAGP